MEYIIFVATLILAVAMVYISGGDLVACGSAVILIFASTFFFVAQIEDKHIINNTIKAIDSELVSQHKAREIVPNDLCVSVRAHYVRRFKSTKALKGTDCASGLLVVTKTKVEK